MKPSDTSTLRQPSADGSDVGAETISDMELRKLREDLANLPEAPGLDEYEDVPVEGFGAALLSGYGWKEGRGIGRNAKEDVKVAKVTMKRGRGAAIGSIDAVKQCKTSIDGSYSTKNSRVSTTSMDMADSTNSGSYRSRPAKAKLSDSDEAASESAQESLAKLAASFELSTMYDIYTKDTSNMPPDVKRKHENIVAIIRMKLGMPLVPHQKIKFIVAIIRMKLGMPLAPLSED